MKSPEPQNSQSRRILAIHGFTGEPFDFAPLYESGRIHADWRFVTLPGHYRELTPDAGGKAGWSLFCDRVAQVVEEAQEDGVALIAMGYSMGARLLLRAVLEKRWSLSRLILIGVTAGLEHEDARKERLIADVRWSELIRHRGMAAFVDAWMRQPIISTQLEHGRQGGVTSHDGNENRDFAERLLRKQLLQPIPLSETIVDYSNGALEPVWDLLGGLSLPVDLIAGERDVKFQDLHQRMSALLPRATCHVVPDAGHAPHLENTEGFLALLSDLFVA